MSETEFFKDEAKRRAAATVRAVEAQTAAELVIAVRRSSGDYRVATYHFGFALLGVAIAYMLVVPKTYSLGAMALEGITAFGLGALMCTLVSPLARALVLPKRRQANVDVAAKAAFYDLGISRTRGRSGLLVFLSTFERTYSLVPDVGIDIAALAVPLGEVQVRLRDAACRCDLDAFLAAVESLGPVLGTRYPRAEDDTNELSDEVR